MNDTAIVKARPGIGFWAFVVLMLVLTLLWIGLGVWQVERLQWKEGLIAEVNARLGASAYDLPPVGQWQALDTESYRYHPLTVSGHYADGGTVRVFTSLSEPKGRYGGPGYWILTPFDADGGGTVFVNRGFVPDASSAAFLDPATIPKGQLSLTGIALPAETGGPFTPPPDRASSTDWIRDPLRLAALDGLSGPVLQLTIDLPAGPAGALPQGGETVVDFPNNHLGYAFTWFGLALLTPALLAYWVWRQRRPKSLPR